MGIDGGIDVDLRRSSGRFWLSQACQEPVGQAAQRRNVHAAVGQFDAGQWSRS